MALRSRYDPYREITSLREQMNRLWDFLRPAFGWRGGNWGEAFTPRVDIYQTEDEVIVTAEIPGLESKDDVEVTVTEDTITLRGEIKRDASYTQEGVYHAERYYGSFSRTFSLPAEVKPEEAQATYRNGVLEVRLPKTEAGRRRWVKVPIQ
ncbi:heat shock protein Hsp20 [Ammonifex degensii KC4]|uniref:Heat shock protein Hsp20 n=1 Tax=Ammonifex degensii (strain DSM 10501 / KC4) TaxID=429009 RepID=C9RBH0_AMMDK|nr:Hsp20/alpha crystallin family protein [Ammonifex degensii]ACX51597.1 heat shock protein Hsp20 [Ammonifex degensii KC4]